MKDVHALVRDVKESIAQTTKDQLGRDMGWVSLLIGVVELTAPRQIQRLMGLEGTQAAGVIRALGVREVMHGVDLLAHKDPTPGIWGRVAGDVLDGVCLGMAATKTRKPMGLATVAALVVPVVAADAVLAACLTDR